MSTTETMVRTKIAQILGPTRVVLAAGADQGVREGMEFVIYELSEPIYDPETNEPLGQLELHKGRVKVIHVQGKIATAATLYRRSYRPGLADFLTFPTIPTKGTWGEEQEKLAIDSNTIVMEKRDPIVRVGDLVRSIS